MIARVLFFSLVLAFSSFSFAQQKMDFVLRSYVDEHRAQGGMLDLIIRGDAGRVATAVRQLGGLVKLSAGNVVSARVPVERVEVLAQRACVTGFEFSMDRGRTLNDSARAKSRIDLVQQGLAPLPMPYDGEGVLVGIIDTGSDFRHDDFKLPDGRTRVLKYWDHYCSTDTALIPDAFGYGQEFDSARINAGTFPICPPNLDHQFGHGTTVMGSAASNGNATGNYIGGAPAADLIVVGSKLSLPNWRSTIVDAVKYILDAAAELGRPVVINISLGSYSGSHDGLDGHALLVDSMLNAAPGRMLVSAAGNSNQFTPYHLRTDVTSDTSFTWFQHEANTPFGADGVYFEVWSDSADFANVQFAVGADRLNPTLQYRGRTVLRTAIIDSTVTDTLWSLGGNLLGVAMYYAQRRGDQVKLQVALLQPDSSDHLYRFISTGSGRFDVWSQWVTTGLSSDMISNIPDPLDYPDIVHYVLPDHVSTIVDSWTCLSSVLTVANYINETSYVAANDSLVVNAGTEGEITTTSSHGPTRDGRVKPDLGAPGDVTLSAGPPAFMATQLINAPFVLAHDSLHLRNGGTSMASPVVTGAVALYLQELPGATPADIVNAFTTTAAVDGATGAVPNDIFGHGKLDAFAALVSSNFTLGPLTVLGDTAFCPGDSVGVMAPAGTSAWWWSDGATTQTTYATDAGPLSVEVWSIGGCVAHSDTAWFTVYPEPSIPVIILNGATLESTPAEDYQWLLEGSPIGGANAQTYDPLANGNYQVITTDINGCTAVSDTLLLLTVGMSERGTSGLSVWPSPAHDQLYISMPTELAIMQVEVIAGDGRKVLGSAAGGNTIDISSLAPGSYELRVRDAAGQWRQARFVKR